MTSFDAVRDMERSPGVRRAYVSAASLGDYAVKRAIDAVVALVALLVFAPLLATIWVAVVITSRGPGLHWSPRVGRYGRKFWMPKFRTMRDGAPRGPRESFDGAGSFITPLGAWLRRASLDELPQLYSIVRGDMSFVGPRPLLADDPGSLARERFRDALEARPGLTGLAQIKGRNCITARRKARLDAFYARKASLALDLEIFARTLAIVFSGRGFI